MRKEFQVRDVVEHRVREICESGLDERSYRNGEPTEALQSAKCKQMRGRRERRTQVCDSSTRGEDSLHLIVTWIMVEEQMFH
jgi:hypothetical protein